MKRCAAAESNKNMGAMRATGNSKRMSLSGRIPSGVSVKKRVITGILVSSLRIKNSATPWTKWKTPAILLNFWSCLPSAVAGFMMGPLDNLGVKSTGRAPADWLSECLAQIRPEAQSKLMA